MSRNTEHNGQHPVSRRRFMRNGLLAGSAAVAGVITGCSQHSDSAARVANSGGGTGSASKTFVASGVMPHLTVSADLRGPRSECGIGALMPWAGRLWLITYVAHTGTTGGGTGLYYVDDALALHKHPASVVGTYANRFVHGPSEQMLIGPHVIDADNHVRTIGDLVGHRLTATMTHLTDPENKVYMLGMESLLWEVDVRTLAVKLLFTLNDNLALPAGYKPHYKGGFTTRDRVIVGNNTYHERDEVEGVSTGGRLAEWDGRGNWRILEETAFTDINGTPMGDHANALAIGWDRASVLLNVLTRGRWTRYRLPNASRCYDHAWYTEWPRIREVETERFLMDVHGMFYELPRQAFGGHFFGVKPVCQHLRMVPDFCTWKGFLVLAGDQNSAVGDNALIGEPQSNLWFGATDDLWRFGKPQGWGGPWRDTPIKPGKPSDPFLMTGFEHKCLHLAHDAAEPVTFTIEVDFLGNGSWRACEELRVNGGRGYRAHVFPIGFSAHWVRLTADRACTATAQFVYT